MTNNMKPTMKGFYQAVQSWLDSGRIDNPHYFSESDGLCILLCDYINGNRLCDGEYDNESYLLLSTELKRSFYCEYGTAKNPFNSVNNNYEDEADKYTNTKRLNWIREHL